MPPLANVAYAAAISSGFVPLNPPILCASLIKPFSYSGVIPKFVTNVLIWDCETA